MPSWAFRTLFIIFAAILAGTAAKAQSVGIHNSGKGFGLAFQEYDKDGAAYSSFILYADIYGLPLGKTAYPGIKGNYSRNHFFGNVSIDRAKLNFYAGPGFTAGYVHDGERSVISHEHLVNHPGVICALSGTAGCLFTFGRHIALDLFLQAEVGFHIRKDEFLEQNDLTFYSNGLTRAWIPHLLILYKF